MTPLPRSPRRDLERIWTAALAAIDPRRLVAALPPSLVTPPGSGRVVVVGGGKAAAGMAAGVADLLGAGLVAPQRIRGVVSVPTGVRGTLAGGLGHGSSPGGSPAGTVWFSGEPPARTPPATLPEAPHPLPMGIEIRATRPPGVNQPTAAVVAATGEMLRLLATLGADDVAIAVITGGGSALLEQPADGVDLADVIAVTEALSRAGAGIEALNTVRRAVSRVKAGGLARACRAGRMVALVLSDVIGDPLDFIASGPCMPTAADPTAARAVLDRFAIAPAIAPRLAAYLAHASRPTQVEFPGPEWTTSDGCHVRHMIVGHNATAVAAARAAAGLLGYRIVSPIGPAEPDGAAESVGFRLARLGSELARQVADDGHPRAWIEGGEATVTVPTAHGRGGRNQQTVLAALVAASTVAWPHGLALASIGTDGEDGPTDAAGAVADADVWERAAADPTAARGALERCDAHPLLDRIGGLVRTGPTGTNVADLRVVLAAP